MGLATDGQFKVHYFTDNSRKAFANGAPGPMANTLCRGNFRNYETSKIPGEVTCQHCQRELLKMPPQLRQVDEVNGLANIGKNALIAAALAASARAYAPYSRFHVGAALGFADGAVVTGANVENASYGLALCAETVAVARAMADGARGGLVAVAVIGGAAGSVGMGAMVTPCGRCRQVLHELAALGGTDPVVWSVGADGVAEMRLSQLLPLAFGPENLG